MKTSIIFNSGTGNTKQLAEAIQGQVNAEYCGKPNDAALDSDLIYVGFWTIAFSCDESIASFLKQVKGKKIFLFGTAGYDYSADFYGKILTAVKEHIDASNTVVGEFMCQGKVSPQKQEALKEAGKFDGMKDNLARGESHPDQDDLAQLKEAISKI